MLFFASILLLTFTGYRERRRWGGGERKRERKRERERERERERKRERKKEREIVVI
jgi:hypothetical protein